MGRPLVEALLNAGHMVAATSHSADALASVEAIGARPVLMDGLDEVSVRDAVLGVQPEVVVNQMTSLAAPSADYGTWLEMTNRLRVQATATLMNAAHEAGARRVVAQSASFMTEPRGTGPTDEDFPLYFDAPEPIRTHVHANVAAELRVVGTDGIEGLVLRYGFLYGAGTAIGPGGDIATAVEAGRMPIVGEGKGQYPMIHVDDAVSATVHAVHHGEPGIYNIVDDDPARQADWLPFLADLLGGPPPPHISEDEAATQLGTQSVYYGNQLLEATNARARTGLGMQLVYPSWRQGFAEVFAETDARKVTRP